MHYIGIPASERTRSSTQTRIALQLKTGKRSSELTAITQCRTKVAKCYRRDSPASRLDVRVDKRLDGAVKSDNVG
jgi:hypothetical protein